MVDDFHISDFGPNMFWTLSCDRPNGIIFGAAIDALHVSGRYMSLAEKLNVCLVFPLGFPNPLQFNVRDAITYPDAPCMEYLPTFTPEMTQFCR